MVLRCSQEKSSNYFYIGCIPCLGRNVLLKSRKGIMLCPIRCWFAVAFVHLLKGSPGCTGCLCAGINGLLLSLALSGYCGRTQ